MLTSTTHRVRAGLIVSALDFRSSGLGSSHSQGTALIPKQTLSNGSDLLCRHVQGLGGVGQRKNLSF